MPRPRTARYTTLALTIAIAFTSLPGCGGGPPPTGTSASPVDADEAAKQKKAMEDFTKTQKKYVPYRRP